MKTIRTIQFVGTDGQARVGVVDGDVVRVLKQSPCSIYALAERALAQGSSLAGTVLSEVGDEVVDYDLLEREERLLPPVTHPTSPANFLVTGTGLTHIGSASARNSMHHGVEDPANAPQSDSMRLFKQGLEGGKPSKGEIGAMPEWFYKGDGACLVPSGQTMSSPNFARSCAEEPEITGIYLVGPDGTPWRLGYTICNDLSDHETERRNFMYVAPSKLRDCAMGPELLIGDLPAEVDGMSRVIRDGRVVWESPFMSGEEHMSYSIANLEHHHFRHVRFRRPGDLHAHLFGCPVMSFGEGFRTRSGDMFEFDIAAFGRPLRNKVIFETGTPKPFEIQQL